MAKKADFKLFLISLIIAGGIAGIAAFILKVSFWASFGVVAVAMVLNGIIAIHEDDGPGGFNNPQ